MSKQTINIGASPNDGTGTPLRTSFDYTNQNFTELYTALGGGVGLPGATTQVIFNDGGTNLAGDAGLVYNKTTDALTVAGLVTAGSAAITGDLTVDTSTLKVDSTNNRVGIGTATPASALSFPIGTVTAVGMTAATAHIAGNVSTLKFGINDGGGDFGGVHVFNTHNGTYSSSEVGIFTGEGGVSVPTQRLRVDKTGKVGIGTATPAEKLTIDNTLGAGAIGLRVFANDQSTARMGVHNTNGQSWQFVAGYAGANNQGLSIFDSTTNANRLYLDTSGNANIINGNLIIGTSGKGIDFSATANSSGTMTSELLNDYEEGTFTPTVIGSTTAGVGVYSAQSGIYTKVGRQVTVQIYVSWSAHTGTGNIFVGNLPFTNASNYWSASVGYLNNIALTAGSVMTAFVEISASYITLWQYPTGGGAATEVPIDATGGIMLSASYNV